MEVVWVCCYVQASFSPWPEYLIIFETGIAKEIGLGKYTTFSLPLLLILKQNKNSNNHEVLSLHIVTML